LRCACARACENAASNSRCAISAASFANNIARAAWRRRRGARQNFSDNNGGHGAFGVRTWRRRRLSNEQAEGAGKIGISPRRVRRCARPLKDMGYFHICTPRVPLKRISNSPALGACGTRVRHNRFASNMFLFCAQRRLPLHRRNFCAARMRLGWVSYAACWMRLRAGAGRIAPRCRGVCSIACVSAIARHHLRGRISRICAAA